MKRITSIIILSIIILLPYGQAQADSAINISGSFTGSSTNTYTALVCDPNNTPVIFSGWVEVTGVEPNGAAMFGLVDQGLIDSGDSGWGSGAYAYFGRIGTNIRIGPSDGFLNGELNSVGANVPYVEGGPNEIEFILTIYDGEITVTYAGNDYTIPYGGIEDANVPDAYPGSEFVSGTYVAINTFPDTNLVDFDISISGCTDAAGPDTTNLVATPNPVAVNSLVEVSASVDDTNTGGSIIASAQYSLDGGTWTSMDADDGDFDEVSEDVNASFAAPAAAGIYDLCVRGTDAAGNVGEPECIMLVVYDPDGGFVTGGGWIDSPSATLVWDQGFETDTSGWFDSDDDWYGEVTRVTSGNSGIPSSEGAYHAVFEGDADSAPFSRFDGFRDEWSGTWIAEIDVYLDPAWASGTGFDYSVAATGSDGNHQRDYIFHVTNDTSTGKLLVAGSNNTNFAPREDLENINHYEVTTAGWYTLQHVFYEDSGALAVDLNLLDSLGTVLFTETRFNAADTIPAEVGGNRYAWFTFINVAGGIAADEHQLLVPMFPTGKANFGFVSKYKKGATVPEGNTEFQFEAGDLNFHSTSYEWLLVTGSDYAKFKGSGTINGAGDYKFMLWAGDNDPDTFRIKIWYEDGGNEIVVYDNGMDQPMGGGNIVVHKK